MKKAVFSGTFDPVTMGHVDIIGRAARLFDEVHVVVARNPEKNSMFTGDERLQMLTGAVSALDCADRVICAVWDRPVFEYCAKIGSRVIVKGVRNAADFDYEKILARQTESLFPDVETVCLFSDGKYDYVSSSYVRGCIEYGMPLGDCVPESVVEMLNRKAK